MRKRISTTCACRSGAVPRRVGAVNQDAEKAVRDDFARLWGTGFLDDLRIDDSDYTFANGVVGKILTYNIAERERAKIVDYFGSMKVTATQIDERLRTANIQIRADSFIDDASVRKVEGIVREMLKEKGFPYADVTHTIEALPGGPKLVHLAFNLSEGPKSRFSIDFDGNKASLTRCRSR